MTTAVAEPSGTTTRTITDDDYTTLKTLIGTRETDPDRIAGLRAAWAQKGHLTADEYDTAVTYLVRCPDRTPATPETLDQLRILLAERDVPAGKFVGLAARAAQRQVTQPEANAAIHVLSALPYRTGSCHPNNVPVGYYALGNGKDTRFYRVSEGRGGRPRRVQLVRLDPLTGKQRSGARLGRVSPQLAGQVLTAIARDVDAASRAFATLTDCCRRCGKTLTRTDSRISGYGPDCITLIPPTTPPTTTP